MSLLQYCYSQLKGHHLVVHNQQQQSFEIDTGLSLFYQLHKHLPGNSQWESL